MRIRQQLVASRKNIGSGTNSRRSITVHETGNTGRGANAAAHANLQSRPNPRVASWHWTVDDREAIQSFLHTARTFHAGRAEGNNTSISIEICVNSDGDYVQAVKNAAALVARIMADERLPISAVRQHHSWSGKNCPTGIRASRGGMSWAIFLTLVAGGGGQPIVTPPPVGGGAVTPPAIANDLLWQLTLVGHYDGLLDGVYGPMAKAGVKSFQRATGLFEDGVVGPITTARLQKEYDMTYDRLVAEIRANSGISEARVRAVVADVLAKWQDPGAADPVQRVISQIFTKEQRRDAQLVLFNIEGEEGDCVAWWGTGTWAKAPSEDTHKRFLDVARIWMRLSPDPWNLVVVDWRTRVGNPDAQVTDPLAFGREVEWSRLPQLPVVDEPAEDDEPAGDDDTES